MTRPSNDFASFDGLYLQLVSPINDGSPFVRTNHAEVRFEVILPDNTTHRTAPRAVSVAETIQKGVSS